MCTYVKNFKQFFFYDYHWKQIFYKAVSKKALIKKYPTTMCKSIEKNKTL